MIPRTLESTALIIGSESEGEVPQSCPTLCDPMDCSPPGSSVHAIFQAWVLEWVAISFSRWSSRPRNRTQVSRIVGRCFHCLGHQGSPYNEFYYKGFKWGSTKWRHMEDVVKVWEETQELLYPFFVESRHTAIAAHQCSLVRKLHWASVSRVFNWGFIIWARLNTTWGVTTRSGQSPGSPPTHHGACPKFQPSVW